MSGFEMLLIVLGIVLAFAVFAIWIRSMMRKLAALWAPNTAFVKGTFSRFRAKVRGTYQDRPVMAYLGNASGADDSGPKSFTYTLRMTVPPAFENWAMANAVPRKGEPPLWSLKARSGPADQLRTAGLLAAVERAPRNWHLRYRAGRGRLELSIAGVDMYFCPDLATFQAQLDLLSRLASITQAAAGTALPKAA